MHMIYVLFSHNVCLCRPYSQVRPTLSGIMWISNTWNMSISKYVMFPSLLSSKHMQRACVYCIVFIGFNCKSGIITMATSLVRNKTNMYYWNLPWQLLEGLMGWSASLHIHLWMIPSKKKCMTRSRNRHLIEMSSHL